MELIITASVKKSELEPLEKTLKLEVIKIAAKKSLEGIGESIKSSLNIPFTCLKKIYITSIGGAARAIFLIKLSEKTAVLVVARLKKDKLIGSNMSIKNLKFKNILEKNLTKIFKDIKNGNFEKFTL